MQWVGIMFYFSVCFPDRPCLHFPTVLAQVSQVAKTSGWEATQSKRALPQVANGSCTWHMWCTDRSNTNQNLELDTISIVQINQVWYRLLVMGPPVAYFVSSPRTKSVAYEVASNQSTVSFRSSNMFQHDLQIKIQKPKRNPYNWRQLKPFLYFVCKTCPQHFTPIIKIIKKIIEICLHGSALLRPHVHQLSGQPGTF